MGPFWKWAWGCPGWDFPLPILQREGVAFQDVGSKDCRAYTGMSLPLMVGPSTPSSPISCTMSRWKTAEMGARVMSCLSLTSSLTLGTAGVCAWQQVQILCG